MKRVRALVVDDSALVRKMLTTILQTDPSIDVVGVAADAYVAREKIKHLNPDVLTLDVEMPRMDGVTFLGKLMRLRPMPVVMVSSLTERGADVTLEALALGAVDFVAKPKVDLANTLADYAEEIIGKVKAAARANVRGAVGGTYGPEPKGPGRWIPDRTGTDGSAHLPLKHDQLAGMIIAIGASTGGIEAIKNLLVGIPETVPGVVVTQHIPPVFSASFARRLDEICAARVCEADDGQPILPGHVYIAPGARHLVVEREGAGLLCRIQDSAPVNRHRPSVDVLFDSVAEAVGGNSIGLILTGMGDDGARGLKSLRDAGAVTFAQDEDSSVVWGMPGEAVRLGAAEKIVPLADMAAEIVAAVHRRCGRRR